MVRAGVIGLAIASGLIRRHDTKVIVNDRESSAQDGGLHLESIYNAGTLKVDCVLKGTAARANNDHGEVIVTRIETELRQRGRPPCLADDLGPAIFLIEGPESQ